MFDVLTRQLFATPPRETLYHYTSLAGVLGIVGSAELRASDIRYMNDSTELRHTLDLLGRQVTRRILAGVDNPALLNAFLEWLSHRVVSGPMLFGASFRANGNLLSQWRGYSVHGKGVSLGMAPAHILASAEAQDFQVGRCIYAPSEQDRLIGNIIDAVEQLGAAFAGEERGENPWLPLFQRIEGDLLRIAAVLKHPAFEEEQEWRIVSPVITDVASDRVAFREGSSMLIPYYPFDLRDDDGRLSLEHCYLGPTGNIDLSMNSLRLYLDGQGARPRRGITYCDIPYRKR
ncbi:DUF2971 domain-containing protein [Pseudohaliea rubra]|uniref:DUF2971 domain-containing protein n=1 Tax=Pseudohaliea rubra DSM 19751 TaxID=1265313 RepID=A0A095XTB8_9GAMM|nr:DUF2971 domain-containing protein [Pseudohaliea rubra]KGE02911.1 hypothetical protein HRUBRA_02555 [Pseudohaliea rubra DSM 19751]